ncbi:hypothetical protein GCK72_019841 [Caenorhabditis remanei]|uniref:Uncharacterized protein n=1 Tax=Caenorhabditis remanei TaxID=31234 RepID=A0A6A5GF22_CAERE|nr:hypothetical protein GCK72_019841 [Caenorhabditis remanei]KAF1753285.1 hypothetical protein GCK72_019841 [Caenorhabditis remanei]
MVAWLPLISLGLNMFGGMLGKGVGQPPPVPPPLPPPPPPAPPQIIYVTNPAKVVERTVLITQTPYPPATRPPETLTIYGIVAIIFILVVCMISMAGGIGFYMWQNSRMEAEKRANESRDRDFYEMEAGRGRGGRRGGRRSESSMSSGGTSGTRTRTKRTKRR